VAYHVVLWHIEHEEEVWEADVVAPNGTWELQYGFFDGAEHELRVTAKPAPGAPTQFAPVTMAHLIDVQGVSPPLWVKVRTTIELMLVVAVGLVVGFWVAARQRPRGSEG